MFSNTRQSHGEQKKRSLWTPGWVHAFFSLDDVTRAYRERGLNISAVTPCSLIYIYEWQPGGTTAQRPFACVYYADWSKLAERLVEIAETDLPGFDLVNWNLDANSQLCRHSAAIRGAFWNVPMRWLEGLFTVTMIDDEPDDSWLHSKNRDPAEVLRQFHQLKEYAGGRHLDTSLGFRKKQPGNACNGQLHGL